MKLPQLEKKPEIKSCHNKSWTDDYSWIHQSNILEVLKDSSKLLPDVRKYLEDENDYFADQMKNTKDIRYTHTYSSIIHLSTFKIIHS